MTWTADVAAAAGSSESGLKLILGQLSGYPIFLFYRHYLRTAETWVQQLYFLLTGLFMAWWAIGPGAVLHSSLCVAATYLLIKTGQGNKWTATAVFLLNMGYLFTGYMLTASSEYDITWTMPQCVLCLRLIGLGFDVWDGTKPEESWSKDQAAAALRRCPSILECFSHSFFLGGYFVGPQFSMKKFQNFIVRNQTERDLPSPVPYGLKRLGMGVVYMSLHLLGSAYYPENWVLSDEYASLGFLRRNFGIFLWSKFVLCKYISAWLLAEGACVISGLSYNGKDEQTGKVKWDGAANVRLRRFESCRKFQHLIEAFNINTNAWVMSYVYKRLKFLNNKVYSQLGALGFLAIWHGYHSGYYVTFLTEFIVMMIERELFAFLERSPIAQRVYSHPAGRIFSNALGHLYFCFLLPHCFSSFVMLKSRKFLPVYAASRYTLQIYMGVGLVASYCLKRANRKKKQHQEEDTKKKD